MGSEMCIRDSKCAHQNIETPSEDITILRHNHIFRSQYKRHQFVSDTNNNLFLCLVIIIKIA